MVGSPYYYHNMMMILLFYPALNYLLVVHVSVLRYSLTIVTLVLVSYDSKVRITLVVDTLL